jgi:chromatin remodeling complex protein RSC6
MKADIRYLRLLGIRLLGMINRVDIRALEQLSVPPLFEEESDDWDSDDSDESDSDSDDSYTPAHSSVYFNPSYPVNPLLVAFMGLEPGMQTRRADTQRAICEYIRDNNLASPDRKSVINLDQALKILLRSEGPLTYPQIVTSTRWLFPTKEEAARILAERYALLM